MTIIFAKKNGLLDKCHKLVNITYKQKYDITLGTEPYPDDYIVLVNEDKIIGCCGIYYDRKTIMRFDLDKSLLENKGEIVELTKLAIVEKHKHRKNGLTLTMCGIIHYLQQRYTIIFHSGNEFISKVLDFINIKYHILATYPKSSDIYNIYKLNNIYLVEVSLVNLSHL